VAQVMSSAALRQAVDAARADARRLRVVSHARCAELRRWTAITRRQSRRCSVTVAWIDRTREVRCRSAWSDLPWQLLDRELDTVLVPIDGDN
jgi:hypothetical protein